MSRTQISGTNAFIDVDELKSIADPETVAECLGIDTRRRGKGVSILCPCHDDRHYGSCYLTRDGFRCYACGATGDIITLTQIVNNSSFVEACTFISDIYGIDLSSNSMKRPRRKKLLDDESLKLIGLARDPENERVYIDLAVLDAPLGADIVLQPGQRLKWEPSGSYRKPDQYILQELISSNPLRDLLENDEPAYHDLIARKAGEAAEKYRSMIQCAQNPARFIEEHPEDYFFILGCCTVLAETGAANWIRVMENCIRQCENIRIEHSRIQKATPTSKKPSYKNVFGKLSSSGISF